MKIFQEIELREVFADIYHYAFDEFGDSDYAYFWAKLVRGNIDIVNSYFNDGYLFKRYKRLLKKYYNLRGNLYTFLVDEGIIEPFRIVSNQEENDQDDSDLADKFKEDD